MVLKFWIVKIKSNTNLLLICLIILINTTLYMRLQRSPSPRISDFKFLDLK